MPEVLASCTDPDPHVYWIASLAASRRLHDGTDQVVLVSGESGAGKTEATKLMLRHILYLSSQDRISLHTNIEKVCELYMCVCDVCVCV